MVRQRLWMFAARAGQWAHNSSALQQRPLSALAATLETALLIKLRAFTIEAFARATSGSGVAQVVQQPPAGQQRKPDPDTTWS